tara:strand:+ start:639 stop:1133 length:495 start_codon:yes stop_codon:yes gene_type:complete
LNIRGYFSNERYILDFIVRKITAYSDYFIHQLANDSSYKDILIRTMWPKIRLSIYGVTALAGLIWPFYFILQFINLVRNGNIQGSIIDIGTAFFDDAWITPTSGFISADTAILLISVFIFYAAEGKRLKLNLWGIYFPLTFLISLAFSFGAFMFMRELKINKED